MGCQADDGDCVPGRLRRGLCERHYRRQLHHGTTASPWHDNRTRHRPGPGGCLLWTGPRNGHGYGWLSVHAHGTRLAHRAAYIDRNGPLPADVGVRHTCAHRHCVNPDHLIAG